MTKLSWVLSSGQTMFVYNLPQYKEDWLVSINGLLMAKVNVSKHWIFRLKIPFTKCLPFHLYISESTFDN